MKSRLALVATAVLLLAGCRQGESPLPMPDEGVQEELGDVRRDLQDIASNRDTAAAEALAQDLRKYVVRPSAVPAVDEMARLTSAALPGRILSDEAGERLAYTLWVAATARELSERQIETLQNDVQSQLTSLGVAEDSASSVAAQVGRVQGAVTDRQRRWYELF
jgi:hypothetical protein